MGTGVSTQQALEERGGVEGSRVVVAGPAQVVVAAPCGLLRARQVIPGGLN